MLCQVFAESAFPVSVSALPLYLREEVNLLHPANLANETECQPIKITPRVSRHVPK